MYEIIITQKFKNSLRKYNYLIDVIDRKLQLLRMDLKYPSLRVKKLEPRSLNLYSLRINKQMRIIFSIEDQVITLLYLSKHYE